MRWATPSPAAWPRRTGDRGLVETLERNGPPPYKDNLHHHAALSREMDVHPPDRSVNAEGERQMSEKPARRGVLAKTSDR